jgi:putative acetyltransferase
MSPSIDIRPQRPDHPEVIALLDALDAYLASLYEPEANHILDVRALLAPEVHFIAAWCGPTAVGCGAVRRMPAEAETAGVPYGEIKRMYVVPEARGQRIGERVMQVLEVSLKAQGIKLALLETGADQHAAMRLYERAGYVRRGPFGGYPDNGLSVFYEKRL